jgi:hypothetical protein
LSLQDVVKRASLFDPTGNLFPLPVDQRILAIFGNFSGPEFALKALVGPGCRLLAAPGRLQPRSEPHRAFKVKLILP